MRKKGAKKGQSMVEFALLLPILLLVLAIVVDLGRLFYSYVAVTDAAGEGAAYAAIHPPADCSDAGDPNRIEIIQRIQNASGGLVGIEESMVALECPSVAAGAPVTVTVHYPFNLSAPFVGGGQLDLMGIATEAILSGN